MSAKCMNNWLSERASEQVSECIILHRIISRSHVTTTTTTPTTIHNKGKHSWSLSRIWTPPRTHTQRFFISWIRQKNFVFFLFFRIEQRRQARERGKYDSIALVKVHWIAIQFHRFRMRLSYFTHRALIFTTGDLLSIHRIAQTHLSAS